MSTEVFDPEVVKKFNKIVEQIYKQVEQEFKDYSNNPYDKDLLKCLKKKYNYLNRFNISKRTKITNCKAYIYEMFLLKHSGEVLSESEKDMICRYCIDKIKGLYKHAQALKTGYCNSQIINGFSEENTLSVCATKNTLEANEQWLTRLFKELNNRFPRIELKEKIMIISSKKNTLKGNATHCKNMNDAWSYFRKKNDFKIVFICSNKTRIQDIFEMAFCFLNLNEDIRKDIRILHDEAHNIREGVPPFRYIIENILRLPNVLSYMPITASLGDIAKDEKKNPIWIKRNLENNAVNFTEFDNTKSTDDNYSSISDYKQLYFEDLKKNPCWKDYERNEMSREKFINVTPKYKGKNIDNLTSKQLKDIDKRRQLEFCKFMKIDKEKEALNNGLNILNLNEFNLGTNYFIKDKFNLHIISTPRRRIISQELCYEAIKKDYDPIVLGIYGKESEKYHLFMSDHDEICVDKEMGDGEFNCKLARLIEYLKSKGINTERPLIIIGNYTPTGESLSFVNYEYGIVRSVIRLISTNAEEDYQTACRGNFMKTLFFKKLGDDWICPDKYLIGPKKFIDNAISYERENDARIDFLSQKTNDSLEEEIIVNSETYTIRNNTNGTTAIPIKVKVDYDDNNYEKLIEISEKKRRTKEDKKTFLKLLKESCSNEESDFEIDDKSGKFNWDNITLNDFRCYTKDSKQQKGYWKFKNYQNNHKTGVPFINNTSAHKIGECELLMCTEKYILKDENGKVIEKNSKDIWWIGYKY